MKETTEPKRNLGSLISKNLIVLLVILVAFFVGTVSWFTKTTRAYGNDVNVKASLPPNIEIAIVPKGSVANVADIPAASWKNGSVAFTPDNYPTIFQTLKFADIDGNGTTFYKPVMSQNKDGARPNISAVDKWATAEANTDYLSVDVYARTIKGNSFTKVQLASDSTIRPNSALTPTELTPDAAVGAVRCSFQSPASGNPVKIWIPAPKVHYDSGNKLLYDNKDQNYSFNLPYMSGENTYETGTGFKHYYYLVNGNTATFKKDFPDSNTIINNANKSNSNSNDYTLGADTDFIKMNAGEYTVGSGATAKTYLYGKTYMNIWFEGEDTEARLATVEGKFVIDLKFKGN